VKKFERYTELGVITESFTVGELKAAAAMIDGQISKGYGDSFIFSTDAETAVGKIVQNTEQFAERIYQATDTLLKVWGFEVEKAQYAKQIYGKKVDELTPEELEDIEQRAARVVRLITPSNTLLPKVAQYMRVLPFFSTFLAWNIEMVRVMGNRVTLPIEEIRDSRTRSIGIKRLATSVAYESAIFAASYIGAVLAGIGWEEMEALAETWKPWEKLKTKVPLKRTGQGADTEIVYYMLGQTDPYGLYKTSVWAMLNNRDQLGKGLKEATAEMYNTFATAEMVFQTANQLFNDVNFQTKKPIQLEGVDWWHPANLKVQSEFVRKRIQPGFAKVMFDLYDAQGTGVIDEFGNVTDLTTIFLSSIGLRTSTIRPMVAFENRITKWSFEKAGIEAGYNSQKSKSTNIMERAMKGDSTPEQLEMRRLKEFGFVTDRYDLMNDAYNDHLQEVKREVDTFSEAFGIPKTDIYKILLAKKYTVEEIAVISGRIPGLYLKR